MLKYISSFVVGSEGDVGIFRYMIYDHISGFVSDGTLTIDNERFYNILHLLFRSTQLNTYTGIRRFKSINFEQMNWSEFTQHLSTHIINLIIEVSSFEYEINNLVITDYSGYIKINGHKRIINPVQLDISPLNYLDSATLISDVNLTNVIKYLNVSSLHISSNNLRLPYMSNLKKLTICDCTNFGGVSLQWNLEELYIDNCRVNPHATAEVWEIPYYSTIRSTEDSLKNLNKCKRLKYLSIKNTDLEHLPNIESLPLETLVISDSSLVDLHHSIVKLNKLKSLVLTNNNLTDISYAVTLVSLEHLDISGNNIRMIPVGLSQTHLREFLMDGSDVTEIPSDLFESRYINSVSIRNCKYIRSVQINPNYNLTYLDLTGTSIKNNLLDSLGNLGSLRTLILDNMDISEIPKNIKELSIEKISTKGTNIEQSII